MPDAVAGAPVCVEWPGQAIRGLLPPTVEVTIRPEAGEIRRIRLRGSSREPRKPQKAKMKPPVAVTFGSQSRLWQKPSELQYTRESSPSHVE